MQHFEAKEFFEQEMLGRWNKWDYTGAQANSWIAVLKQYDQQLALDAVNELYASDAGKYHTPNLSAFQRLCKEIYTKSGPGFVIGFYVRKPGWDDRIPHIPINVQATVAKDTVALHRHRVATMAKLAPQGYEMIYAREAK